jgi:CubicO group peptidase (beta-lactamase class C family)
MKITTLYRHALCIFALTFSFATTGASAASEAPTANEARRRLDATVPALLAEKHIASVSIARIEHARIAFLAAYGEARAGTPATPDTLYNIASMTKPISAEVLLRLIARRTISLDEPMSKFWVDADIADDPRRDLLTPRLSLSHRTGFPNWRYETDDRLRFLRTPGEAFGYSGEGFEYMAHFAEKKTGTPFERLAQTLVFGPSGMHDTAYTRRPWFADRMAVPTDADGKALSPQIAEHFLASDDLYTTPRDYARFIIGLMKRQGMNAALAAERVRIQTDRKSELCPPPRERVCADEAGFGLGWEVFRFGEHTYLMHTGMDQGTFTLGYFEASTGSGTIIFTNSSNGPQSVLAILDTIGRDREFVDFLRLLAN